MKDAAAPGPALDPLALAATAPPFGAAQIYDVDLDVPTSLPRDHPGWQRDVLSVSARARAIVAQLRPVVVRVLTFWDHACAVSASVAADWKSTRADATVFDSARPATVRNNRSRSSRCAWFDAV